MNHILNIKLPTKLIPIFEKKNIGILKDHLINKEMYIYCTKLEEIDCTSFLGTLLFHKDEPNP
jgi:hypothetical protein